MALARRSFLLLFSSRHDINPYFFPISAPVPIKKKWQNYPRITEQHGSSTSIYACYRIGAAMLSSDTTGSWKELKTPLCYSRDCYCKNMTIRFWSQVSWWNEAIRPDVSAAYERSSFPLEESYWKVFNTADGSLTLIPVSHRPSVSTDWPAFAFAFECLSRVQLPMGFSKSAHPDLTQITFILRHLVRCVAAVA